MLGYLLLAWLWLLGTREETPNDPKLSDGRGWRGPCMVGGKAAAEARAVTATPVRCSAWLGVSGCLEFIALRNPKRSLDDLPCVASLLDAEGLAAPVKWTPKDAGIHLDGSIAVPFDEPDGISGLLLDESAHLLNLLRR